MNEISPSDPTRIPHVPVVFAYDHEWRRVDVSAVWRTQKGAWMITGRDLDRNNEWRSFTVSKIKGKIRILEA